MSPTLTFILAFLATHTGLKFNLQLEKDEVKRMQEYEDYLHQEMAQLLQEIEGNGGIMEGLLSSTLQQQWLLWVTAAALVLLALGCWRIKRGSSSCREQKSSKRHEMVVSEKLSSEEKVSEHEEIKGADSGGSTSAVPTPSPVGMSRQGLPSTKELKELVDEVLGVCRVLSRRNFMPELHPAAGTDTSCEACSFQENSSVYCPLVILRPPPGHSFSPEQPPAGSIRVALECLCSGEQLLGPRCFLHTSGGQLPQDQDWYMLDTLCTDSCLDPEKVTHWVQMLVLSAWLFLPHSSHCQLTALPSSRSCSFQLRLHSGLHCRIDMALAVEQGSSGDYLSLEQAAAGSPGSTMWARKLLCLFAK